MCLPSIYFGHSTELRDPLPLLRRAEFNKKFIFPHMKKPFSQWKSQCTPFIMQISLLIKVLTVAGAIIYIGTLAATCYKYRASKQDFNSSEEITGKFRLGGLASNPRGSVGDREVKFDLSAFGEAQGGRAKLIPNGATVKVSIATIRTSQGLMPLVVKASSDHGPLFSSDAADCEQRFNSATAFIFVISSVLAFVPVLIVFSFLK